MKNTNLVLIKDKEYSVYSRERELITKVISDIYLDKAELEILRTNPKNAFIQISGYVAPQFAPISISYERS